MVSSRTVFMLNVPFKCFTSNISDIIVAAMAASVNTISIQSLPPEAEVGEIFQVILGEIRNPHKFYIQSYTRYEDLCSLMDDLNAENEANFLEEAVDTSLPAPQVGMYVAARWKDEMWYRARVVKFKTLATVSLFYIDYGSEEDMDWWKVRCLDAKFWKLPAQAVAARLAGVAPRCGNKWGKEPGTAMVRLTRMSDTRGLWAILTGTHSNGRHCVWLIDTAANHVEEGISVAESLVWEGQARLCKEEGDSKLEELVVKPRVRTLVSEAIHLHTQLKSATDTEERKQLEKKVKIMSDKINVIEKLVIEAPDRKEDQVSITDFDGNWCVRNQEVVRKDGLEIVLHLVLGMNHVWVTDKEVSALVIEWKGWNLLESRLKARGLSPEVMSVSREDDGSVWDVLMSGGVVSGPDVSVLLYRLDTLPQALTVINEHAAAILAGLPNYRNK